MLATAVELVVQSLQVVFDRKLRIKREDVAGHEHRRRSHLPLMGFMRCPHA